MKPLPSLIVAVVLAANVAPAQAQPNYAYVIGSKFGLFNVATPGAAPIFSETDEVPYKPGQQFGWALQLATDKPAVRVREEIRLPAPAASFAAAGKLPAGMTVAADRRSAVFERDIPVRSGLIFNIWSVAQGDPKGDYVIRVTVDGGQLRQFNFTVQ